MTSTAKSSHTPDIGTTQFQNGNEIDFTDFSTAFAEVDDNFDLAESTVSVSANDTHAKHLYNAITAGPGITKEIASPSGDETIKIGLAGGGGADTQAIINGYFQIDQLRNAEYGSFTTSFDDKYFTDEWKMRMVGTSATIIPGSRVTTSLPTLAQVGLQTPFTSAFAVNTADAAVAAGDLITIFQPIEGFRWAAAGIAEQEFTVNFWVRSPVTGTFCVAVCNSARNRFYTTEYTISSANTWEQKEVTIGAFDGTASGGTWYYDDRVGMELHFVLMAGTNFQGGADAWSSTTDYATNSQANAVATGSTTFYLTNVTINSTTPYRRSYVSEMALCRRYLHVLNRYNDTENTFQQIRTTTFYWEYPGSGNAFGYAYFHDDYAGMRERDGTFPVFNSTNPASTHYKIYNNHANLDGASSVISGVSPTCESDPGLGWLVFEVSAGTFTNTSHIVHLIAGHAHFFDSRL